MLHGSLRAADRGQGEPPVVTTHRQTWLLQPPSSKLALVPGNFQFYQEPQRLRNLQHVLTLQGWEPFQAPPWPLPASPLQHSLF